MSVLVNVFVSEARLVGVVLVSTSSDEPVREAPV